MHHREGSQLAEPPDGGMYESLPLALAEFDGAWTCLRVNRAFAALAGLPAETLIGRSIGTLPYPFARHVVPLVEQTLASPPVQTEVEIVDEFPCRPGSATHLILRLQPHSTSDVAATGWVLFASDVTEQRQTQTRLLESRALSLRVLDSLSTHVCMLTPDGTVVEANRPPLELSGLELRDVRGKKYWDCFWWSHDPEAQDRVEQAVTSASRGETPRFDIVKRMTATNLITVELMLVPLRDEDGRITHLISSAVDVSARKAGEDALLLSERRFRQVVEAAPDGMAMVGMDGRIVLANASMEHLFGYRRDEMLGQPVELLMPERYRGAHGALFSGYMQTPEARDMAGRRELYARRKDGSEFPVEIGLNPISTSGETMVLATIQDVTTRKAYRDLIEKALAEKTVLLNEIHHRVKNNLQVISSLLSLQARASGAEVAAALAESQRRVKAMALIHQLLYEHSDFSGVDLAEYLRRLCRLLAESFTEIRNRVVVDFQTDEAGITLDLQRAVPCGLLVNELVTNSIKHGFPDGRRGQVRVTLNRTGVDEIRLEVADDGVGISGNLQLGSNKSLGFQLIPLLAEQTGGILRLDRASGTRYELFLSRISTRPSG